MVGENGAGKSTLVEGLAVAVGMNAEGGSQNVAFATTRWPATAGGRCTSSPTASRSSASSTIYLRHLLA
ncbi:hypothetical protein [Baekduia alba]|uniref:hypothetical protein n=1 Tax=Baekduia alba TaxID=2997333 RepID=UPI0032C46F16